jgi:cephalosporin-C deacetylase-like acetyl esterase
LENVRKTALEMLGAFPEPSSLHPKVVRTFKRDGYRVENVMFQSLPNFWVTGNLYIPEGISGRVPGIISPCGHYPEARMAPEYQSTYINLVKGGFVVLAYDPIGQGERRQYWDPKTAQTEVGGPTTEHSMAGQLLLLLGENLTHYRVWDGIRAIDYLLTRPEVDPQRIGCAGHSGGGTLTKFIGAVDTRVQCAVINEGGTANRWPMDLRPESRIGPSDVEQNLFPSALRCIDNVELHAAFAPRPLLVLIEDFHPRFDEAARRIHERYLQMGVGDRFATEEAADPHAWTPKLRLATTNWFRRWFTKAAPLEQEPPFEVEAEKTLYCTPNGSVRHSGAGDTIYTVIGRNTRALAREQQIPDAGEIRRVLRMPEEKPPLAPRHLVTTPRKGYSVEKLEFLSEPGIYIPTWVFVPTERRGAPLLFVSESGKQAEGMEFGLLERLARRGHEVIAVDVRGIGGTRPPHGTPGERAGGFEHLFNVETAMQYMAWYTDADLFGMRVHDVLRSIDYATSRTGAEKIHVLGTGSGALWSLYAAALDPRAAALLCERGLASYRELLDTDRYLHFASVFVRDVYRRFDLPQVAAMLAGRRLIVSSPVDAMKRALSPERAEAAYAATRTAFRAGELRLAHPKSTEERMALIAGFLSA